VKISQSIQKHSSPSSSSSPKASKKHNRLFDRAKKLKRQILQKQIALIHTHPHHIALTAPKKL
jgi:hypothetical protein